MLCSILGVEVSSKYLCRKEIKFLLKEELVTELQYEIIIFRDRFFKKSM